MSGYIIASSCIILSLILILLVLFIKLKLSKKRNININNLNSSLAAEIIHDIKTPLQFIENNLTYTKHFICNSIQNNNEDVVDALEQSIVGIKTIQSQLNSYKKLSYKDTFIYFDISEVISDALILVKQKALNITFETSLTNTILYGSPSQLQRVFINLFNNSIYAIRKKQTKEGLIKIHSSLSKDSITIKVEDNGMGIKEENIGKIFNNSYSSKERGKGSGFGLYNVKKIIEVQHSGKIYVESEFDIFTKIIIKLPILKEEDD